MPLIEPGNYKIVRVDGTEENIPLRATMDAIHGAIGCECTDSIILTRDGGVPEIVMLVDDTGMVDGKPINQKATALYRSRRPKSLHCICGDVAICWDGDFA